MKSIETEPYGLNTLLEDAPTNVRVSVKQSENSPSYSKAAANLLVRSKTTKPILVGLHERHFEQRIFDIINDDMPGRNKVKL